jgi:tetratricopeptide (TPR) repeat protein
MDSENLHQVWASIQNLQTAKDLQQAEMLAGQYLARPEAAVDRVAELLVWALELPLDDNGRSLARQVAPVFMDDPAVSSLCILILTPELPAKSTDASALLTRLDPEALSKWKALMARAYLLKAQYLESVGDWNQMADQAEKASSLGVDTDESNYWLARALLHLGNVPAAAAALGPRPLIGLKRWVRLSHIIALQNDADFTLVNTCIQVLEGKWGLPEPAEKDLAMQGIEQALQINASDKMNEVIHYNTRLSELIGPMPTLQFYITVKELRENRSFERQLARLNRDAAGNATSPPMSRLLKLICTLVVGRRHEFASCLETLPALSQTYTPDLRFFQAMELFLEMLAKNKPLIGEPGLLEDLATIQSSRLGREMPVLASIGLLCRSLILGQALPVSLFQALNGCVWAQWLWLRSWCTESSSPEEIISFFLETEMLAPALLWDELAWIQEFQAFLPPEGLGRFQERLLDYEADLASLSPFWQEQVALRGRLANRNIGTRSDFFDAPLPGSDTNPWWVEDHFLQEIVKVEQKIETFYLRGRLALRQADLAAALKYFKQAQTICDKAAPAGRLSLAGRFLPYWEGVTQAHLGHYKQAAELLGACLSGPKRPEAGAQLGMIAFAEGKLPEAQSWLNECLAAPELPATRYLCALLVQDDNPDGALKQLVPLESDGGRQNTGYFQAARRLHAAIQERSGDPVAASRTYRHILETRPADSVAALRLARLWAFQKHEALRTGQELALELPALEFPQEIPTISWGAALTDLVKVLQKIEASASAGISLQWPVRPAHQRMLLRAILSSGNAANTLARLQAPAGSQDEKYLDGLRRLNQFSDLLGDYLQAESDSGLQILDQMTAELQSLDANLASQIPAVRFWNECLKQMRMPQAALSDSFLAIALDENMPLSQRTWVAAWGLFSPEADQRQKAAQMFSSLATGNTRLDPHLRSALLALAAQHQKRDQEFLGYYTEIEKDFNNLPFPENEIYLLACEIRLQARLPSQVLHSPKPAALSPRNPELEHLHALAYIQSAAQDATGNPHRALMNLDRAVKILESSR